MSARVDATFLRGMKIYEDGQVHRQAARPVPAPPDRREASAVAPTRRQRAGRMPPGTPDVPVAIVGAGACGLTAALMLRDAGIDCVLLERDARAAGLDRAVLGLHPGGRHARAARAPACTTTAPTRFAARHPGQGPRHAPRRTWWRPTPRPSRRRWTRCSRATACAFELLDGFLYPGHRVLRMHTLPQRTGAALVAALDAAAARAGATAADRRAGARAVVRRARTACSASAIARPDGTRRAPGLRRAAAGLQRLRRQRGDGARAAARRCATPSSPAMPATTAARSPGAAQLGARLADLGGYQGHGSWAVPQGALITWALMMEGGVQVNAEGRRFHDETGGYSEAAVQVLAQPGRHRLERVRRRGCSRWPQLPGFRRGRSGRRGAARGRRGGAGRADRLRRRDARRHARRHAAWPRRTTRSRSPARCSTPRAAWTSTRSAACCVHDGTPFPNLLAAGGAARGVSGNAVWGYLSGNGLLSAVAGGCIAARTAAAQLGGDRMTPQATTRREPRVAARARRLRRAVGAGRRTGRLRGALPVGRLDRLHAARPLRRRPDHLQRGRPTRWRASPSACALPVIVDADTGFGNALNVQRTRARLRARRRRDDPARGPDLPQALRPPRRQGAWCPVAEMQRQAARRARCARQRRHADPRAHRRARRRRAGRARSSAPRPTSHAASTRCSSRRCARRSRWTPPAGASRTACRCWPTWSKAARRRCRAPTSCGARGFRIVIFPGGTARAVAHTLAGLLRQPACARQHRAVARPHARLRRAERRDRHPDSARTWQAIL